MIRLIEANGNECIQDDLFVDNTRIQLLHQILNYMLNITKFQHGCGPLHDDDKMEIYESYG